MEKQEDVTVILTAAEADHLAFYIRWSQKRLFGDYDPDQEWRHLLRSARKKIRQAQVDARSNRALEIITLEKMVPKDQEPPMVA